MVKLKNRVGSLIPTLMLTAMLATRLSAAEPPIVGGIEVGARGCRAVVVQCEVTPWKATHLNVIYEKVVQTRLGVDLLRKGEISMAGAVDTAKDVNRLHSVLRADYSLPPERIYIVAASSLSDAKGLEKLTAAIREETDQSLVTLTPAREIALAMHGMMPAEYMSRAVYIDAGSNTLKLGVVVAGGHHNIDEFRHAVQPGTVAFATTIQNNRQGNETFSQAASRHRAKYAKAVATEVAANPALANRKDTILSGGIVWALVTLTKPEQVRSPYVQLTAAGLQRFAELVEKPDCFDVDLSSIRWSTLREEAGAEIHRVRDTFTIEQLQTGAAMLLALSQEMKFESKSIFFPRSVSWIAAYAAEQAGTLQVDKK